MCRNEWFELHAQRLSLIGYYILSVSIVIAKNSSKRKYQSSSRCEPNNDLVFCSQSVVAEEKDLRPEVRRRHESLAVKRALQVNAIMCLRLLGSLKDIRLGSNGGWCTDLE